MIKLRAYATIFSLAAAAVLCSATLGQAQTPLSGPPSVAPTVAPPWVNPDVAPPPGAPPPPPPAAAPPPPPPPVGTVSPIRGPARPECREFQQQIMIGGQPQRAYGTACRQADGTWKIVH